MPECCTAPNVRKCRTLPAWTKPASHTATTIPSQRKTALRQSLPLFPSDIPPSLPLSVRLSLPCPSLYPLASISLLFCYSIILPFHYSAVLPFCHSNSAVLPFCHSIILPFLHSLPLRRLFPLPGGFATLSELSVLPHPFSQAAASPLFHTCRLSEDPHRHRAEPPPAYPLHGSAGTEISRCRFPASSPLSAAVLP